MLYFRLTKQTSKNVADTTFEALSQLQHSIVIICLSFVSHVYLQSVPVLHICSKDLLSVNGSAVESCCSHWIHLNLLSILNKSMFFWAFGFDSISILFLAVIWSLPAEGSLSQVLYICFKCPFFCLDWINVWILALISLTVFSIWL